MSIKKISLLMLLFCFQIAVIHCAAGEEDNLNQFGDQIITAEKNFNELYPQLAYGFELIDFDFQQFMQERLIGRLSYEMIENEEGQRMTLLDDTIMQAEKFLILGMQELLERIFYTIVSYRVDLDQKGIDVLQYAINYKEYIGSQILKPFIYDKNSDGQTKLMTIASHGHAQIIQILLNEGADVNARDNNGRTALMLAAAQGHIEAVQLLIAAQAGINFKDRFGRTALMYAAADFDRTGRYPSADYLQDLHDRKKEVIKILLAAGANVNERTNAGNTALMYPASSGDVEIASILIDAGADVDIQNNDGITALMCVAHNGNKKIVTLLIDAGAKVNIASNEGCIALSDMIFKRNAESQKKLKSLAPNYKDTGEINESEFIAIFKMLIKAGSNVNYLDRDRRSVLFYICTPLDYRSYSVGFLENLVKLLIAAGADVTIKDNNRQTVLEVATKNMKKIIQEAISKRTFLS